ncbi:NAD(+) synthase [Dysgonomonadaceae bacterium zrk40]|nr:NAD(+) synthase [Dysgonomonadaceae bacterium zrk40]
MYINRQGFIRVAATSPRLRVADCDYNRAEIQTIIGQAVEEQIQIICFPELALTGYSCGDLFFQETLQREALSSLQQLALFMRDKPSIIAIVGLPMRIGSKLFNMAAVISAEGILGVVPKSNLPNDREYYEKRWFAAAADLVASSIQIGEYEVPTAPDGMIFRTPYATFGVEICEDLWMPIPPSSRLAMEGAELLFNLSASNELVGKHRYRKSLVLQQSGRCNAAYIYASAGTGESSTDMVFSGACLIAENGTLLAESKRFSPDNVLIATDIDLDALRHDRLKNSNYKNSTHHPATVVGCSLTEVATNTFLHPVPEHPFIPSTEYEDESLAEVFSIQTEGLAKRLRHTGIEKATIGISGGLDSTLALLVTIATFDRLQLPRENIVGITMPGFGTTNRTYRNAIDLMHASGITVREIPIEEAVKQHFKDIGHDIDDHSVTYENSQARERTQILMDVANKIGALVVGTGNLSELALGWATYNGDQMSMYGVNASVPKTLVATLVRWIADNRMEANARTILHDILDTPFSPELLPAAADGQIAQKTEHFVGPYELHDFFLHRMLRFGDGPARILFLARLAFAGRFADEELTKWLRVFYKRFFSQQFKRSCMPDGPKVGSVNLSPRGDWRMPSDAMANLWLKELEEESNE